MYTANDYTSLEQAVEQYEHNGTFSHDDWQQKAKVSVIINVYNQPEQLRKALLALTQQTYHPQNIEVVIVDDGGRRGTGSCLKGVAEWDLPFDVKYVWQPDTGFRLAKARNEGIKKAAHEHLICMDADMIPEHTYVEEVMKMRYAAQQAGVKVVTIQNRAFANPEEVTDNLILEQRLAEVPLVPSARFGSYEDWREERYAETNRLKHIPGPSEEEEKGEGEREEQKQERDPMYVIGSTLGGGMCSFSKGDALEAGLIDESFTGWGGEDTEFGIRLYEHFNGKLGKTLFFVPLAATAYHLEHGETRTTLQESEQRHQFFKKKVTASRKKQITSRPEVSVYIPCYNQELFIQKAIESVARQQFDLSQLEVVVGEDGSTDHSPQIIQKLQQKYRGRMQIRSTGDGKNRGRAANTNRAIQASRGKYILQLDADDELLPTAVSKLYQLLQRHPQASFAFGDCLDRNVQTGEQRPHWSCNEFTPQWYARNKNVTPEELRKFAREGSMRFHHPRMFRRDAYLQTEGVEEQLENAIDFDLYLKLAEVGFPLHLKEPLYIYNHHGNNTSRNRDLQIANDLSVRTTAAARDASSSTPRKELYILDDTKGTSTHVNLRDPSWRFRNLEYIWQERSQPQGTSIFLAMIRELETITKNLRWIFPEPSASFLDRLQQLAPQSTVGHYYAATFLMEEQRWEEALAELGQISHPGSSAKNLEARILQMLQQVA